MKSHILTVVILSTILGSVMAPARPRTGEPTDATPFASSADRNVLMSFTTDGCTDFDEDFFSAAGIIHECCVQHDFRYWLGGAKNDRLDADQQLRACISQAQGPLVAAAMYRAVRIFGRPGTGKSYQWGYGWQTNRGYEPVPKFSTLVMMKNANINFIEASNEQPQVENACEALQITYQAKEALIPNAKKLMEGRPFKTGPF